MKKINGRIKIGSYLFMWNNIEQNVLQITELLHNQPYRQLGLEVGETTKITYFGFGEEAMKSQKKILITKDCFLYHELSQMIKELGEDKFDKFCPTIIDIDDRKNSLSMDSLNKYFLKFNFNFNIPIASKITIEDKNNAVKNCIMKSFQKLNQKYFEQELNKL